MIQPLLQPFHHLSVGRPFMAGHPRMTTMAAIDVLLQQLRGA